MTSCPVCGSCRVRTLTCSTVWFLRNAWNCMLGIASMSGNITPRPVSVRARVRDGMGTIEGSEVGKRRKMGFGIDCSKLREVCSQPLSSLLLLLFSPHPCGQFLLDLHRGRSVLEALASL